MYNNARSLLFANAHSMAICSVAHAAEQVGCSSVCIPLETLAFTPAALQQWGLLALRSTRARRKLRVDRLDRDVRRNVELRWLLWLGLVAEPFQAGRFHDPRAWCWRILDQGARALSRGARKSLGGSRDT